MLTAIDFDAVMQHIGQHLAQYMEQHQITQNTVATVFGVKQPSVSGWLQNGRMARKHYQKLVEWSGLPIEHWLGLKPIAAHNIGGLSVREPEAQYGQSSDPPLSNQDRSILAMFHALPKTEQEQIWRTLQGKAKYFEALYAELTQRHKQAA